MKLSQWVNRQCEQLEVKDCTFPDEYDVIVVGLGTAGAISAIKSAKLGLKVLGIEQQHCMGGIGTAGGVHSYYFGSKGGLFEQLDEQAAELHKTGYLRSGGTHGEVKKLVLEEAAAGAGVDLCYESVVIGVYMNGSRTAGVRWLQDGHIREAGCRILIDCTGDASIAAMAGYPTRIGRDSDRTMHAYSNVITQIVNNTVRTYYSDSGYVDPTDVLDMSNEIIRSSALPTNLKETYEDSPMLLKTAPQLGLREGRFIVGEATVTMEDYTNDKYRDNALLYAYANLDNHAKDMALESELQQDWTVVCSLWGLNISVPIPLAALIPSGADNMLVAGRCLSVDHDLASCVRMMRDMQKSGEVAAVAAYWAIKLNSTVKKVPHERMAAKLTETGCMNGEPPVLKWITDIRELEEGLRSEKPGMAIWSAKRIGSVVVPHLLQWCAQQEHEHLRKHSAFALGLLGEEAAFPVLRQMVTEYDEYLPKTSGMYNQLRVHAAIYLLGKLGDTAIIPELIRIVTDCPVRVPDERLINDKFIVSEQDYRFQYISYSLMALLRIGDKHPEQRQLIAQSFSKHVLVSSFQAEFLLNSRPEVRLSHTMTTRLQKIAEERMSTW